MHKIRTMQKTRITFAYNYAVFSSYNYKANSSNLHLGDDCMYRHYCNAKASFQIIRLFCIQMQRLELRLVTLQIIITVSHFMGNFACYKCLYMLCASKSVKSVISGEIRPEIRWQACEIREIRWILIKKKNRRYYLLFSLKLYQFLKLILFVY